MPDLSEMVRVLYRHDWTNVDQWATQIRQLADLTDLQISELIQEAKQRSPRSRADSVAHHAAGSGVSRANLADIPHQGKKRYW